MLLILLGLYLPAVGKSVCLCLGPVDQVVAESCCSQANTCCEDEETDAEPCCGNPDCCVVVPALPEGMEPQLTLAPLPTSLPSPFISEDSLKASPLGEDFSAPLSHAASPPLPGCPVRIVFGVWRL